MGSKTSVPEILAIVSIEPCDLQPLLVADPRPCPFANLVVDHALWEAMRSGVAPLWLENGRICGVAPGRSVIPEASTWLYGLYISPKVRYIYIYTYIYICIYICGNAFKAHVYTIQLHGAFGIPRVWKPATPGVRCEEVEGRLRVVELRVLGPSLGLSESQRRRPRSPKRGGDKRIVYIYVYIYICINLCIWTNMYICIYVYRVCAYIYIYVYTRVFVCIYVAINK